MSSKKWGAKVCQIRAFCWQCTSGLMLRDSKSGARTVWIGDESRALIDSLPRIHNNPWLLCNGHSGRPLDIGFWNPMRNQLEMF